MIFFLIERIEKNNKKISMNLSKGSFAQDKIHDFPVNCKRLSAICSENHFTPDNIEISDINGGWGINISKITLHVLNLKELAIHAHSDYITHI